MPDIYTLRAPENFNYNYDHYPSPSSTKSNRNLLMPDGNFSEKKPEMYYIKSNNDKQISSHHLSKSSLSPIYERTNSARIRPESHHLKVPENHTKNSNYHSSSKLVHESPSQNKITMYMIKASNEDNSLSHIQHTRSPIHSSKKKPLVKFNIIDDNNKYNVSNKQHYNIPSNIRYIPLSKSKAKQSIQRSINKYRFRNSNFY